MWAGQGLVGSAEGCRGSFGTCAALGFHALWMCGVDGKSGSQLFFGTAEMAEQPVVYLKSSPQVFRSLAAQERF